PDVTNPDVTNATIALSPGESARITLRVVDPDKTHSVPRVVTQSNGQQQTVLINPAFDPSRTATPVVRSSAVNTADAENGITIPPSVIALVITTTSLGDGI